MQKFLPLLAALAGFFITIQTPRLFILLIQMHKGPDTLTLMGLYLATEIALLVGSIRVFRRQPAFKTHISGVLAASALKIAAGAAVGPCLLLFWS